MASLPARPVWEIVAKPKIISSFSLFSWFRFFFGPPGEEPFATSLLPVVA
jgi:hypothetical protein